LKLRARKSHAQKWRESMVQRNALHDIFLHHFILSTLQFLFISRRTMRKLFSIIWKCAWPWVGYGDPAQFLPHGSSTTFEGKEWTTTNEQGELIANYRWTGWFREIIGWSSRVQENYPLFNRNLRNILQSNERKTERSQHVTCWTRKH
jgi:hypothetical protein